MLATAAGCDDANGAVGVDDVAVEFDVAPGSVIVGAGVGAGAVHIASFPSLGARWWWFALTHGWSGWLRRSSWGPSARVGHD